MLSILKSGLNEIIDALKSHPQWFYLGVQDIKLRYRRSMIGPWWVTISTGIMIAMLGFLWSHIFNQAIETYLPFFTLGFILWNWISAQLNDAASGFNQFQGTIKQIKLPFPIFTLRLAVRQTLILLHNAIIIVIVLLLIGKGISWVSLLAIPSLILIQCIVTLISIIIMIFCTRYQDMAQVVNVFTQILFYFTPILWQVELIKNKPYLAEWNPLYHWIEMIRAPLLGNLPTENNILWSLSSLGLLLILAVFYLGRYRSRIALWL
jgi:ABC-type polysaccharide/polyol phosphate export permease